MTTTEGPDDRFTTETDWEAVFFDVGGVVVDLESIRSGYADYLRTFAAEHDLDPARAIRTWRDRLGEYFGNAEGSTYRPAREGYRLAFEALVDDDLADEAWRPGFEAATRDAMEPEPNAVETIRRLGASDLYVGIVSDIDTWEAERILDMFDLAEAFDGVTTSEAVGYRKPDQRMFRDAIERAGVDPARSLYVGDREDHDMRGGTEAGFTTVAYGGTAAESVGADRSPGPVADHDHVDFFIEDLASLVSIAGVE